MARKKTTDRLSGPDRALQIGMATLGAILLFGALGVVIAGAVGSQRPAFVEVVETERAVIGGRTLIQVDAINRGDVTAAAVTIEGAAPADRTATATLDYVPGRSRTAATLTFDGDLGDATVTLKATGWVDP